MKEQRDTQIAELKTLADQSGETAQHDFEKKVSSYIRITLETESYWGIFANARNHSQV